MFNPVSELSEGGGSDRAERKQPCIKCHAGITIKPPVDLNVCWCCYAGHFTSTKPQYGNLKNHPTYIATVKRIQDKLDKRAVSVGGSA